MAPWGQSLEAMQVPPPVKIRFLIFQKYISQIVQVVFLDIVIFCFSIFLVQLPVAVGEEWIQPKILRHKASAFSELSRARLRSSECFIVCHDVVFVWSKHVFLLSQLRQTSFTKAKMLGSKKCCTCPFSYTWHKTNFLVGSIPSNSSLQKYSSGVSSLFDY